MHSLENSDGESSSDDDWSVEEESNLCFMARSAHLDYDGDDDFENEPIKVKYDMLLDAFQ